MLQSLVLVLALLAALNAAAPSATTAMIAGIVATTAVLDPWITGVRVSLLNVTHRTSSLAASQGAAWVLVLATSLMTAALCAGAVYLASPLLALDGGSTLEAAQAAAGFGVPAAISALLASFGDVWGPLLPAVGALLTALTALLLVGVFWVVVAAVLSTLVSLAYAIHHFSDARVFA